MDEYKTVLNNVLRLNRIAFRRVLLLTHDILILRTNGVQSKLPKTSSSKCAYTCIQTFNMIVIVVIAFIALTCERQQYKHMSSLYTTPTENHIRIVHTIGLVWNDELSLKLSSVSFLLSI